MSTPKIALITGGSAGIGKATAIELARKGFRVYITGRSKEKTENAIYDIIQAAPGAEVDYFLADMSSIVEVRKLAEEIQVKVSRLDVLVNNAGGVNQNRELTVDGFEKTFATNHLSYFLLTNLLLDLIKKSAPARIVNVSSMAHYKGRIDFSDLHMEKKYFIMHAYANSKLCNVLFTYELARRLEGTGVTANCLHPGVVSTKIGNKNTAFYSKLVWNLVTLFKGINVDKGAATSVYLASSDEVEGVTGKYYDDCKEKRSAEVSYDLDLARKLWEESEKMTGLS